MTQFSEKLIMSSDGVDPLYTEVTISVSSVWHPNATTTQDANQNNMPAAAAIAVLRRTLMEPRKQLIFTVDRHYLNGNDSNIIVQSPQGEPPGGGPYPCDAKNGPIPISCDIINLFGEQTAIVNFSIVTWIAESTSAHGVISNRWTMSSDFDESYYTQRTIVGEAIFRTDILRQISGNNAGNLALQNPSGLNNIMPDRWRAILIPKVPIGFQRVSQNVTQDSSGTKLNYKVVDMEQPLVFTNKRITRVSGSYTDTYGTSPTATRRGAAHAGREALRHMMEAAGRGGQSEDAPGLSAAAGALFAGIERTMSVAEYADSVLPKRSMTLEISVTGRYDSNKRDLITAMQTIIAGFGMSFGGANVDVTGLALTQDADNPLGALASFFGLGEFNNVGLKAWVTDSSVTVDIFNKKASCKVSYFAAGIDGTALAAVGLTRVNPVNRITNVIESLAGGGRTVALPPVDSPAGNQANISSSGPGNENDTRGSFLQPLETAKQKGTEDLAETASSQAATRSLNSAGQNLVGVALDL